MLDTKLTIKPYLNNNIKKTDANKTQVYVRVIYNKKNTQMSYKKALFETGNISLTDEEFNQQFESIKEKASKFIIPIMNFLKKYSKDDVNTLSSVMEKLNKNVYDVCEELQIRIMKSDFAYDYDKTEIFIDAYGNKSIQIPENPAREHIRYYFHAFIPKEITLFQYLAQSNFIDLVELQSIDLQIIINNLTEHKEIVDKEIIKYLIF